MVMAVESDNVAQYASIQTRYDRGQTRRFLEENDFFDASLECCHELRIMKADRKNGMISAADRFAKTMGGWFTSRNRFMECLADVSGVSAYITCNPVHIDLQARIDNQIKIIAEGQGTADPNVICLRNLFFDIDSDKLAGMSATDEERQKALDGADALRDFYSDLEECSTYGSSGNGAWMLVRLPDLANTEQNAHLCHQVLLLANRRFPNVDTKTANPSRVCGIAGIWKCKGANVARRPWRFQTIDSPVGRTRKVLDLRAWLERWDDGKVVFEQPTNLPPVRPHSSTVGNNLADSGGWNLPDNLDARISAYLQKMPDSIQGQDGSASAMAVANKLVNGYGLALEQAFPLMVEYGNHRSNPPWSTWEINHKLSDALAKPCLSGKPRGYLLDENRSNWQPSARSNDIVPLNPDVSHAIDPSDLSPGDLQATIDSLVIRKGEAEDPARLARDFVNNEFTRPEPTGTVLTLRYHNGDFWEWNKSQYARLNTKSLKARITGHVEEDFTRQYNAKLAAQAMALVSVGNQGGESKPVKMQEPVKAKATRNVVDNVLGSIEHRCLISIPKGVNLPVGLDGLSLGSTTALVVAKNGYVDLNQVALGDHAITPTTARLFNENALAFPIDFDAPEPTFWLSKLNDWWGDDQESIDCLQEWMGYCITQDVSRQKVGLFIGPPRAGKGTIAKVMGELAGKVNVCHPSFASLETNFGLAPLIGKNLALVPDAQWGANVDSAKIIERMLSISGEDAQVIDQKHREHYEGNLKLKFNLFSNDLPNFRNQSGALLSRLVIFQLTQSFTKDREDIGMFENKIKPEMPGILKWAIDGWLRLKKNGKFTQSKASKDIEADLSEIMSPLKAFVDAHYDITNDPADIVAMTDMLAHYKRVTLEDGNQYKGTLTSLGIAFRSTFPQLIKFKCLPRINGKQQAAYGGIALKDDDNSGLPPCRGWLRGYLSRGRSPVSQILATGTELGYSVQEIYSAREIEQKNIEVIDERGMEVWGEVRFPFE